jgi:hypothetical protein
MKKTEHKLKNQTVFHVKENFNLEEQVAERAHDLWQQRNGEHGNDLTHWFQAEREIAEWHQRNPKTQASPNSGAALARP